MFLEAVVKMSLWSRIKLLFGRGIFVKAVVDNGIRLTCCLDGEQAGNLKTIRVYP